MSLIRAVFALVVANVFAAVASAQTSACIGSSDVACTEQGSIRGEVQGQPWPSRGFPMRRPRLGRYGGGHLHQWQAGMVCVTAAVLEPSARKSLEKR